MNCFLFYSILFYLSYVLANEFDLICPTPRRLLLVNRVPSGSIDEKKSSPPKYARSGLHEPMSSVYIRPKTAHEHKERSYSHLLKSKDKKSHEHRNKSSGSKKKKHSEKKVNVTATTTTAVKTRGLVAVKSTELERCRALLHIDSIPTSIPPIIKEDQTKSETPKKIKDKVKEPSEKKSKEEKSNNKKTKEVKETKEERRTEESSTRIPTSTSPPPPSPPPPTKSKREKTTTTTVSPAIVVEEDEILPNDDLPLGSNHSMVDRAIHFVKNIFQLSDDILEIPVTPKTSSIPNQPDQNDIEENTHRSRKLLSIEEDHYQAVHFSSRRLLATKSSNKKSKSKTTTTTTSVQTKPKVGWAYRYRISRYLAAQKMQNTRRKPVEKKIVKGKSRRQNRYTSIDDDLHHNVTFTEKSPPQRHLSHTKSKVDSKLKSFDHLTDPIDIVRAHDEHGYKPRVGWKYRYRVSAYIEALREEIRQGRTRKKIEETVKKPKKTKDPNLDPELSQINEGGRKVGWTYRYRIRRKLDHLKNQEKEFGIPFDRQSLTEIRQKKSKREKTSDSNKSSKKKENEEEKTKSSLTPEIRSSSSFFAPFVKNSFCLFSLSSCENDETVSRRKKSSKKLRTRKEQRAKQFIRSRVTKLGAEDKYTERRIDERMQEMYQTPSFPPPQSPPPASKTKTTTTTTTAMPRFRTISEVIREEADTFFMNKPSDFRSNEDLQEENTETLNERTKKFVPKKKSVSNHSRTNELLTDQRDFKSKTNKN